MPRKYGNRAGWARIAANIYTVARVDLSAYHGIVALYTMTHVREPLYKPVCGERTLIADDGFRWLQLYSAAPARQTYTVTVAFTPENFVAQWYIDVCAGHGVDHTGIPWHDDLYLDLVASAHGAVEIIDAADLDAALAAAVVGPDDYDLAWREAQRLEPLVRSASLPEMRFADAALDALRALERGATVAGYTLLTSSKADTAGALRAQRQHEGAIDPGM